MGAGGVADRGVPGQPLYGDASRRDGCHLDPARATVGASSPASASDLVVDVVQGASLRVTLNPASVDVYRNPRKSVLAQNFREDYGDGLSGAQGCQRFGVCQVRFYHQLQGRHAIQIDLIIFELPGEPSGLKFHCSMSIYSIRSQRRQSGTAYVPTR
jgi:hypothetical protein